MLISHFTGFNYHNYNFSFPSVIMIGNSVPVIDNIDISGDAIAGLIS